LYRSFKDHPDITEVTSDVLDMFNRENFDELCDSIDVTYYEDN